MPRVPKELLQESTAGLNTFGGFRKHKLLRSLCWVTRALFDKATRKEYDLDDLRLGDIVAILDADHSHGRILKKGAISVRTVVHTNCVSSGHGPGITTLFTSSTGRITPKKDRKANLAVILELRTDI